MDFIPLIIKELRVETDEYQSIIFTKPDNFSFKLGECFSFRFPGENESKVFSFASSPTESDIIISYKRGVSKFKKKLEVLHVGNAMEVALYGSQFHFNSETPSLFIAGGIGITAFRSIIKFCVDQNVTTALQLIFINKTEIFPFKNELDMFSKQASHLSISYFSTNTHGRLTKELLKKHLMLPIPEVYIAGPPLMIDATVDLLKGNNISSSHIHTESFDGYFEES
jgi:ferredoxin-NADP reductase